MIALLTPLLPDAIFASKMPIRAGMVMQELVDLRKSILQGRYADALSLIDELAGMSRQAILRNLNSFLVRLLIHLIKNQVEQRLHNSWATSIPGSIVETKKLNLQDNKNLRKIRLLGNSTKQYV